MITPHVHSYYSFLEGTISVEELVAFAKRNNCGYVFLTDTNAMYGLVRLAKLAQEENIKPVLGAFIDDPNDKNLSVILFAKNNDGYSHLCRIITHRQLKKDFKLEEIFDSPTENLFVLTSSIELLKRVKITQQLRENLFVELIVTKKVKKRTRILYDFAKANNIQIAASHPAYFVKKEDQVLHRVVTAIRLNKTMASIDDNDYVESEFYLKPPEELDEIWRALPEAVKNVEKIARACNVDLDLGRYKFPVFNLPYTETPYSYLWKLAFNGLEERYKRVSEEAIKRLQFELGIIEEMGFCDYFLIVWDIVREAKRRGIMHVGRGSAANSLVAYCLRITEVDPIKYNFYFERFLNPARSTPPDIDLDFSWKDRDEIIKYVYTKYGYDRVAMLSATITFRAKSAFREVAKVLGIPQSEISTYTKRIPWTRAENLLNISERFPETKSFNFSVEPWKSIVEIASRLAGFPRHLSIHASGLVVSSEPLTKYLAVEYAYNKGLGLIITQPDMYSVGDLGLVKIDILSQRSIGVLKDTINEINRNFAAQKAEVVTPEEDES